MAPYGSSETAFAVPSRQYRQGVKSKGRLNSFPVLTRKVTEKRQYTEIFSLIKVST
jgi:hypothetical protein